MDMYLLNIVFHCSMNKTSIYKSSSRTQVFTSFAIVKLLEDTECVPQRVQYQKKYSLNIFSRKYWE